MKRVAFFVLALIIGTMEVAADDAPECFDKTPTRANICERARQLQRGFATRLPLTLRADLVMSKSTAVGPKLMNVVIWDQSKPGLEAFLLSAGLSMSDLERRMQEGVRSAVCNDATLSEFVRSGGRMMYQYQSSDGVDLFAPEVHECPSLK